MPEWHTEIHAGIFSDKLTDYFSHKNDGPIFIGNSFVNVKYERLAKVIADHDYALEGDWKR